MAREGSRDDDRKALLTRRQRAAFWAGWWVVLFGLWTLLVFKTEPAELVAGAVAAAVAATGAELVRSRGSVRFAGDVRWLRVLPSLPGEVLAGTVLLIRVLWRVVRHGEQPASGYRALPFPGANDRGPRAAGRQAVTKWLGAVTPNHIVLGFDDDEDVVLLHELAPTAQPPRLDPDGKP